VLMLAVDFVQWWYGRGYQAAFRAVGRRIIRIVRLFSLPLLVQTLGAPWRRITTPRGGSLGERFQALLDNLISRVVGFCVRCIVILAGLGAITAIAVVGAALLVAWPFLPILGIILIVRGVFPW